ncbi:hypothetical protein [Spiroplasma eriocheiris]|uniref:Uncharacterized protein n=1 Tax=Spiroplasma eriocheiris TaxID=315358 RepID=A0A0H3XHG7_9MOLU|nr:hypothetical protein [Spiroplasma eriocheiris]AHF57691.1 hypothetical protein SPE_0563 [Spiroplasma eriocheiris CCTCC M 207170]AKM54143.1 hypothetical protein SERIO_v1c05720 [Spiroplasma eriocheiris]
METNNNVELTKEMLGFKMLALINEIILSGTIVKMREDPRIKDGIVNFYEKLTFGSYNDKLFKTTMIIILLYLQESEKHPVSNQSLEENLFLDISYLQNLLMHKEYETLTIPEAQEVINLLTIAKDLN